jgi:hypothetical protein
MLYENCSFSEIPEILASGLYKSLGNIGNVIWLEVRKLRTCGVLQPYSPMDFIWQTAPHGQ